MFRIAASFGLRKCTLQAASRFWTCPLDRKELQHPHIMLVILCRQIQCNLQTAGMAAKDPLLVSLGRYLRSVREKRGWSQEELALKCGLHRTYIGAVERGEYNVTLLTLRRITDTLGIPLKDAIAGIRKKGPKVK